MTAWPAAPLWGITAEKLADICSSQDAAIRDITVECEWRAEPAPISEEAARTKLPVGKGPPKCTWAAKRPFTERSLNVDRETIATLLEIARVTGDRRYLEPIPRALAYLERSLLPSARLAQHVRRFLKVSQDRG